MSDPVVLGVLLMGWAAQAVTWVGALVVAGGRAAAREEWGYELAIRAVQVGLIVWALVAARGTVAPLEQAAAVALLAGYLAGHIVAIAGRRELGTAWGIGTRPPGRGEPVVRSGIYRFLPHPIYTGTGVAIAAQAALLQNVPSVVLLAAAVAVIAWKIARENRWLSG